MRKTMFLKIIGLMIMTGVLLTACKKDQPSQITNPTVDLEFVIEQTDFGGLKSTREEVPQCDDQWSMDYVVFAFAGQEYTSPIFTVNGQILTQAVKVNVPESGTQTFQLTKFLVYHDVTGNGKSTDDLLLRAAPEPLSTYHHLMVNKLNLDVVVEAFKKKQVVIDVLCFEDIFYTKFGFTWFELNKVKIERQCFFGDVCTGKLADFDVEESYYKLQQNGVQMDMPAIMQVKTYKKVGGNWQGPLNVFDNVLHANGSNWYGEGACMEVFWANDEDLNGEEFKFELYVHLPSGLGMDWILVDVIEFIDGVGALTGADGVVDFVVGNCQIDEADYQYPAWMDLPLGTFTMKVGGSHSPGPSGTYFDVTLSGIGAGYDIGNGTVGVWCGDQNANIYLGQTYTVEAISSLMPIPDDFTITAPKLKVLNNLINHIEANFNGLSLFNVQAYESAHPGTWSIIQNAIWAVTEETIPSGVSATLFNEANTYGVNYEVLPGQWAAVLFWDNPQVQVLFVMVDP
jgi:hypothetical protein